MSKYKNRLLSVVGLKVANMVLNLTGNKKSHLVAKAGQAAKKTDYAALSDGEVFLEVANEVLSQSRTLMTLPRLHVLWQALANSRHVSGDIAEIGVFRGGSSFFLARASMMLASVPGVFHAIDTFEGHADGTVLKKDNYHTVGMFAGTNYEEVCEYLAKFDFVRVHKGEFSKVAPSLISGAYRLVHIDTDLYQPTLDCLNFFLPKLSPGGVFVIDDYLGRKCAGVTGAVHDFLRSHPMFSAWFFQTEQIVLRCGK